MRAIWILTLLSLGACSNATDAEGAASSGPGEVIETPAGAYRVELSAATGDTVLPSNPALDMLDGDIGKYAVQLCGLDAAQPRLARCEVFAQADTSQLLTGFVVLQQGEDVQVSTALSTDRQRTGIGCFIGGTLVNTDYETPDAKLDVSKTFSARVPFFAWEKSPGDWMVSSEEADENSAGGMWYLERLNDNLRVSQERWNYCYRDTSVQVDVVFRRAATLVRVGR
ncbi:MAG TPA: hypothetical protein DIV82_03835 [Brevundimonas diminuta]|nr:hypothetical protein [Brevundimonas diminuta]